MIVTPQIRARAVMLILAASVSLRSLICFLRYSSWDSISKWDEDTMVLTELFSIVKMRRLCRRYVKEMGIKRRSEEENGEFEGETDFTGKQEGAKVRRKKSKQKRTEMETKQTDQTLERILWEKRRFTSIKPSRH